MGISIGRIKLLSEVIEFNKVNLDKALTYGVLHTKSSNKLVAKVLKKEILKDLAQEEILHQNDVFKQLGFVEINSLDFYPHEKPTFTLDLNKPLSSEYMNKYDLVYDGGTMEHCFNVPMVLENTIKFLKKGGTVVHVNPMSGQVGHGFYQFSPTLYYDFYTANGFDNLKIEIYIRRSKKEYVYEIPNNKINKFVNVPRCFMGARAFIHFSARKVKDVDEIVFPIQATYKKHFEINKGIRHQKFLNISFYKKIKKFIIERFPITYLFYLTRIKLRKIL